MGITIDNFLIQTSNAELLRLPHWNAKAGKIHAIIGESGSGKSLLLKTIMGLLPADLNSKGDLNVETAEMEFNPLNCAEDKWLSIRGKEIGMIFQEPLSALNPQMRCGAQLEEAWFIHKQSTKKASKQAILKRLSQVGLKDIADRVWSSYPHQLSGGQRQRVMIAMSTLHNPPIILADEPTTALDYFSRKTVLEDLIKLVKELGSTLIWVSHELDVVQDYADTITVLRKGELIDTGSVKQVIDTPHPYVAELLKALPLPKVGLIPDGDPHIEIRDIGKVYPNKTRALQGININLSKGQTLGVVGTSGSGKSTLAKILVALESPSEGKVCIEGVPISKIPPTGIQMVFQDPFSSLNRRHTAIQAMDEILRVRFPSLNNSEREIKMRRWLEGVDFPSHLWNKRPTEMSGGQRQRLCIAKALCTEPEILILDEAVAALDPIVQQQVLETLERLQHENGLVYLFITHDLQVAKHVSDKWIYLDKGRVSELPKQWMNI